MPVLRSYQEVHILVRVYAQTLTARRIKGSLPKRYSSSDSVITKREKDTEVEVGKGHCVILDRIIVQRRTRTNNSDVFLALSIRTLPP
jgi:hypothetical protein